MECSISQISLSICKMKTACATNNHGQIQRKCHISSEIPCIRWCKRQQGVQFLIVRSIEIGKLGEMQPASFKSQWIFKCAHTNTRPYSHLISAAVAIIRGKHTAHTQTCINIASVLCILCHRTTVCLPKLNGKRQNSMCSRFLFDFGVFTYCSDFGVPHLIVSCRKHRLIAVFSAHFGTNFNVQTHRKWVNEIRDLCTVQNVSTKWKTRNRECSTFLTKLRISFDQLLLLLLLLLNALSSTAKHKHVLSKHETCSISKNSKPSNNQTNKQKKDFRHRERESEREREGERTKPREK